MQPGPAGTTGGQPRWSRGCGLLKAVACQGLFVSAMAWKASTLQGVGTARLHLKQAFYKMRRAPLHISRVGRVGQSPLNQEL